MSWFFESNDTSARVLRTMVQSVLGVIVGYLTAIASTMSDFIGMLVIPVVICICSVIMSEIGKHMDNDATADQSLKIGGTE